jgi:hypothetical protein|tara:strand:+ start:146 stop:724 length:579 start_codon:yes stop_codon:yes gene_type:complete
MALASSGTLSLNDIQGEFGGSNPIGINEYYRGGSLVSNTSANSGIPTSGTIQIDDFYGGTALSADNNYSFQVKQYTQNQGKNSFQVIGANAQMSDGSIVTNNLNSFTISDVTMLQNTSLAPTVHFSGSGNAHAAYNTGAVRGSQINGVTYSFASPQSGANSLIFSMSTSEADTVKTYLQNNVGSTVTFTITY